MSERSTESVDLATRLADPGDEVRDHLIEGDFGDCWDMPLWQRQHLAAVIESFVAERLAAVEALHLGMHKCGNDFWTDDPTYRGTIANRGICPTRSAMRTPPGDRA